MPTSSVLQTPTILKLTGSTLVIKHPDFSHFTQTSLTAPYTAGGTTLTVRDNRNFADDAWTVLGQPGRAKSEEVDVNQANIAGTSRIARGTSVTITNSTDFDHEIDTPVTLIYERGIKIYGTNSATDAAAGTGTLLGSVDAHTATTNQLADAVMIQWDKPYTEFTLISTDTEYTYYFVKYTDGTTDSSASDYVSATGLSAISGQVMVQSALDLTRSTVDTKMITWEFLLDTVNDFQYEVSNFVLPDGTMKDWPHEIFEEKTSITTTQSENEYAVSATSTNLKYPDSNQGIIQVKLGQDILKFMDLDQYEAEYDGVVRSEVATEAAIGAITLVVDDTTEFADDGSITVGAMTVTYTAKNDTTNTFSGIPASGTGSITAIATVDMVVWQGKTPGKPSKYTVFNNNILLNLPVNSTHAGKSLKLKFYGELSRVSSLSDDMVIPFTHLGKFYIASQIEFRKKNTERGEFYLAVFRTKLLEQAQKHLSHIVETMEYYTLTNP